MELAPLGRAERSEDVRLGPLGRLAGQRHGAKALGRQLHPVPAPILWIGGPRQQPPALELVEERHDVGGLDAKRQRQVALRYRALRFEVVKTRNPRPSEPALGGAAARAPGRGSREPQNQEAASGPQGRVSGIWLGRGWRGDRVHVTDSYSS